MDAAQPFHAPAVVVAGSFRDPDRYVAFESTRRNDHETDWASLGAVNLWTAPQTAMFQRVVDLLQEGRLARLALRGADEATETIRLSLLLARGGEKLRHLFGDVGWGDVVAWVHTALLDHLDHDLLEEYLDLLRCLHVTCAPLMEALGFMEARASRRLSGNASLRVILQKPLPSISTRPQEWVFPNSPYVVLAPGEHSWQSPALVGWRQRLEALGKVVLCAESAASSNDSAAMARTLLRKVQDLRQKAPARPVVLVGMSVGAKVAIMVSFKIRVEALICLSIQMVGVNTAQANAVDTRDLFQLRPPTLFAIGSASRCCPVSLMEQVRLQMVARNKLVIVRDADETLRIPLSKRLKVKLTQAMSDQLVLNEIGTFLLDAFSRPPVSSPAPTGRTSPRSPGFVSPPQLALSVAEEARAKPVSADQGQKTSRKRLEDQVVDTSSGAPAGPGDQPDPKRVKGE